MRHLTGVFSRSLTLIGGISIKSSLALWKLTWDTQLLEKSSLMKRLNFFCLFYFIFYRHIYFVSSLFIGIFLVYDSEREKLLMNYRHAAYRHHCVMLCANIYYFFHTFTPSAINLHRGKKKRRKDKIIINFTDKHGKEESEE